MGVVAGIRGWIAAVLCILCVGSSAALADGRPALLQRAYSHNDYEQAHPLEDALAAGFSSVEADVWLRDGQIRVSHLGLSFKGTLRELYLEPLQRLVRERESVHGDGTQFYLWIELKQGSAGLRQALRRELAEYPMLSRFGAEGFVAGAVTVVLTGHERSKRLFFEEGTSWRAIRDSGAYSPSDPPADEAWQWVALKWTQFFSWNGAGSPKPAEVERLRALVEGVHAQGRKLRFWKTPETEACWRLLLDLGVDVIGTDEIGRLRAFLLAGR